MLAFFSIFKVSSLILGIIGGLFIYKKIKNSKKEKAAKAKRLADDRAKEAEAENSRDLVKEKDGQVIEEIVIENYQEQGSEKSITKPEEKAQRMELKTLLIRVSELIGRGFDQSQIARSLASNTDKEIPKYELAPLVDALKRFLSGYDEKSVQAQEKYNPRAGNDHKAIDFLKRGNPEFAIDILKRKLNQIEGSASSMKTSSMQGSATDLAGEYARHIAILSAVIDMRDSYSFAKRAVELNPNDIKSLDLLGYYELSYDNISEAQQCFESALALDNSGEDRVWIELAQEGLEIAKSKKPDDVHLKGPDKLKTSINIYDIAKAMDKGHERVE